MEGGARSLYARLFGAIDSQLNDQQRLALVALTNTAREFIRDAVARGLSAQVTRLLASAALRPTIESLQRTLNVPVKTDPETMMRMLDAIGDEVRYQRENRKATA
jgi:hypothetical protein